MEYKHIATRQAKLSDILRRDMGISSGLMNRLKWQQKLFVNGQSRFTNFIVQPGDVVSIPMDDPAPQYPAEDGELTVLYEDEYILAADKPAGMLIHPSRARDTGTFANRVIGYYQRTGQRCAFHPVTRLDRDTFGIVLLAKSSHLHAKLQGSLKKTYEAWVWGGPAEEAGVIDAPIARLPLPSLLRQVREDGKPSVTEYRVLERKDGCSRLELRPITGRTHQLRVHCAYMGWPILGDPQYGSRESTEFSEKLGLYTQMLQAKALTFTHPITGQPLRLESQTELTMDNCGIC